MCHFSSFIRQINLLSHGVGTRRSECNPRAWFSDFDRNHGINPISKLGWVSLVVEWGVVRYDHRTLASSSAYAPFLSSNLFLYFSEYDLIGCFYLSISLGKFNWSKMMFDRITCQEFSELTVCKLCSVVCHQVLRYPKLGEDVLPNKLPGLSSHDRGKRFCLYPLREIVDGNNQKLLLSRS